MNGKGHGRKEGREKGQLELTHSFAVLLPPSSPPFISVHLRRPKEVAVLTTFPSNSTTRTQCLPLFSSLRTLSAWFRSVSLSLEVERTLRWSGSRPCRSRRKKAYCQLNKKATKKAMHAHHQTQSKPVRRDEQKTQGSPGQPRALKLCSFVLPVLLLLLPSKNIRDQRD